MTMTTKSAGPGAFDRFDLNSVSSPCFVVDTAKLEDNCRILAEVGAASGAKVLAALKAFSLPQTAPIIGKHLQGVCASGLYEAKLAREAYQGEVATFGAAYRAEDLPEIAKLSDHLIFNSPGQKQRFMDVARRANPSLDFGLRINPGIVTGEDAKYDPGAPGSRLGTPLAQLDEPVISGLDGLHLHSLCEQGFAPLAEIWAATEPWIAPWLPTLKWLNLGGGHHITHPDYDRDALIAFIRDLRARFGLDVYLEPGEAVALDAGILVAEVLDITENGMPLAQLDISATCHMPDVLEAPYRPALLGEDPHAPAVRLGGPSCLTGDVIGDYRVPDLHLGQRLAFLDQAHYTMVKTTNFNGVPLPKIVLWNSESGMIECIRTPDWSDFRVRLG